MRRIEKFLKPEKLQASVYQVLFESDMNSLNWVKQLPVTFLYYIDFDNQ